MLGLAASAWTVIGVVIGLTGLLLMFRYGMPFRVESKGWSTVVVKETDPSEAALDRRYKLLGQLGLLLTIAGGMCQIIAAYAQNIRRLSPTSSSRLI
jgi:hypothetical protein